MLVDAFVAGVDRVIGLELLAAEPLLARLSGGVVPSLDTRCRDLSRFDVYGIADFCKVAVARGFAMAWGLDVLIGSSMPSPLRNQASHRVISPA